mmetsp:Transcript_25762/g.74534  ORF Transcript_25762/g.74534 Transcript_25762/m.74534 type:complete len:263 (-) Transcript_25762:170-958(-)
MQAHRHHLGRAPPAFINQISQIVFEIGGKFSTVTKPIDGKSHVIFAQCVGNNQMRSVSVFCGPVWEVIIICVAIIQKSSLLHYQLARMNVGLALIHAHGTAAEEILVDLNGPGNVLPLHIGRHILIVPPPVPVGGHLPAGLYHGFGGGAVPLQRHSDSIHRAGHLLPLEEIVQSPEPGAAAIIVQRFQVGVPLVGICRRAGDFRQKFLGFIVAMEKAVLSTLFVIQHEVESYLGAVGPQWLGRRRSVPDHVARVAGGTAPVH